MPSQANATFKVTHWDEQPYHETPAEGKLTRAHVTYSYEGDIEGEGTVEYLMAYPLADATRFVGLERVVGRLSGRSGSFVLRHDGTAGADGGIEDHIFVVPGSGTGELSGLRGEGTVVLSGHAESYPITLNYDVEESPASR